MRSAIILIGIVIFLGLFVPFSKVGVTYRGVIDRRYWIYIKSSDWNGENRMLEREGKLLIKESTTYSAFLVVTYINKEKWNLNDLAILLELAKKP